MKACIRLFCSSLLVGVCYAYASPAIDPTPLSGSVMTNTRNSHAFERMIKGQIKAIIKKYAHDNDEVAIHDVEEFIAWLFSFYLLYGKIVPACIKIFNGTRLFYILMPIDALYAYSHYSLYRTAQMYPIPNRNGFISFSLTLSALIIRCWKQVRTEFEKTFFSTHKSLIDIAFFNEYVEEISSDTIKTMEQRLTTLKEELETKGLYRYLHLADVNFTKDFEELDNIVRTNQEQDYLHVFTLLQFCKKIAAYVK